MTQAAGKPKPVTVDRRHVLHQGKGVFLGRFGRRRRVRLQARRIQQPNHLDLVLDTTAVRGNVSKLNGLMD